MDPEPKPKGWEWLDTTVGAFDEEFIAAVNEEIPQQERPEMDFFA